MLRQRGVILTKARQALLCLLILAAPPAALAISVGNLTFSMSPDDSFVAKRVLNNNQSARLYEVSVVGIDSPSEKEIQTRPADGELLFSPKQMTLQPGLGEYFKFYYNGPKDDRERYYRVSFREVPTSNHVMRNSANSQISIDPVVIIDTILVVRPRHIDFKWTYDRATGTIRNTGNTWFKLLIKPGCSTTEEEGDARYLRAGDVVQNQGLREAGNHYIVFNDKFIKISDDCQRD